MSSRQPSMAEPAYRHLGEDVPQVPPWRSAQFDGAERCRRGATAPMRLPPTSQPAVFRAMAVRSCVEREHPWVYVGSITGQRLLCH
jgi:hypothetical protein